MKASQNALSALEVEKDEPGLVADFMVITKARLTFLVLITTFVGFCMASGGSIDGLQLFHTLLGTALVAGSAAIFNQGIEIRVDALMERTRDRPLPAGRWKPEVAFWLGGAMAFAGLGYLLWMTNVTAGLLALATLAIYVLVYTPMKRRTSSCVTVGAISGAIPPVIGWTAVKPEFSAGAWMLFGILFLWQMPHFLAIAWMYRDEYAQAGFHMLKRNDATGGNTAFRAFVCTVGLVAITIFPAFAGNAGAVYVAGALALGIPMLAAAVFFLLHRSRATARQLFFASILYLPLILGLMVLTRVQLS